MQKFSIKSGGPSAPKAVPSIGAVSAVGPAGAAAKPRVKKNTRDYGKTEPEQPVTAPSPNPFGSAGGF